MSIRYGIELVFDPAFTARVYRTRQLVCGQYGCWAAEMHMLRMTLVPYFECPDDSLSELADGIRQVAVDRRGSLQDAAQAGISFSQEAGSVFLDLADPDGGLSLLHREAAAAVGRAAGAQVSQNTFQPRIALLEFGGLPPAILEDAAEYARDVAVDLSIPATASPWRLLLTQYSSAAAGDDWSNGRWAADVSWKQLFSYAL